MISCLALRLPTFDSQPMTVALNNLVQSSTGVKEYNVHFAGAIYAALANPHRLHRGRALFRARLMAGSVKG
jgi:glucose/mannose transport system permease protein